MCRLHHRAGSNPLELHGTTHEVVCMDCGDVICRQEFQDRIKATNPEVVTSLLQKCFNRDKING